MMFTSKCYQCCNSGFNCNANWHPSNEYDWSFNDIRGHRYNEANDKAIMRPTIAEAVVESNDATTPSAFLTYLKDLRSTTRK